MGKVCAKIELCDQAPPPVPISSANPPPTRGMPRTSPPPVLFSLPDDVLQAIVQAFDEFELHRLARLSKAGRALVTAHRHGVVLDLPAGLLHAKQIATVFPKFTNSVLPVHLRSTLTHTGFHFDLRRVLPAILEHYGGWEGMAERRRVVADRARKRDENRKAKQAYRIQRLDAFIAGSPRLAFSGLKDWRRSLHDRGLAPPEDNSDLRAFLGCGTAPPSIFVARSAMERHEREQAAAFVRRAALVDALLKLRVEHCGQDPLFVDFFQHGCLHEVTEVAQKIARSRYLALHADDVERAVVARNAELAAGFGIPVGCVRAHAEAEVCAAWPVPDAWPWLERGAAPVVGPV